ncbi:MAG: alpha-mannosidase, partial [Paenibacillus sp.]|nr:alpha-mannosidase [Paenibacillus sp.]
SSSYPDPEADRAEHAFTYSLYPHPGDHVQAEVYKQGYELNIPLRMVSVPTAEHGDGLADSLSFLQLSHPNVMVEAVKKAEDGDDLIVRLYETAGSRVHAALRPGFAVREAWHCDLMERKLDAVPVQDGEIGLAFAPFDVLTLRLAAPAGAAKGGGGV